MTIRCPVDADPDTGVGHLHTLFLEHGAYLGNLCAFGFSFTRAVFRPVVEQDDCRIVKQGKLLHTGENCRGLAGAIQWHQYSLEQLIGAFVGRFWALAVQDKHRATGITHDTLGDTALVDEFKTGATMRRHDYQPGRDFLSRSGDGGNRLTGTQQCIHLPFFCAEQFRKCFQAGVIFCFTITFVRCHVQEGQCGVGPARCNTAGVIQHFLCRLGTIKRNQNLVVHLVSSFVFKYLPVHESKLRQ